MSWAAKRFWEQASVVPSGFGFEVHLDGRPVRTPVKAAMVLPTEPMALAIADEWDAQQAEIKPQSMPLTRAANSAIDKVGPQRQAVIDMLAEYGGTDLVCYRAEGPESLVARQAEAWDPLLDWARENFGARLKITAGVVPVSQDPRALGRLKNALESYDDFALTAVHDLVTLSGSLVIGLAAACRFQSAESLWTASRLDEIWQVEQWGEDAEAAEMAINKGAAFYSALRFLALSADNGV